MTDYNKLTVANLRQVLKERGIPSTGLTRKAQIIEKLEEADKAQTEAASGTEPAQSAPDEPQGDNGAENAEKAADVTEATVPTEPAPVVEDASATHPAEPTRDATPAEAPAEPVPVPEDAPAPQPTEPMADTAPSQASEQPTTTSAPIDETESVSSKPVVDKEPVVEAPEQDPQAAAPTEEPVEQPLEAAEQPGVIQQPATAPEQPAESEDTAMDESPSTPPHDPNESQSVEKLVVERIEETPLPAEPASNPDSLDSDTKKRKRRSQSPDVPAEIIAKKAKASSDVAPDVHLQEDQDIVMVEKATDNENVQEVEMQKKPTDHADEHDVAMREKSTDQEEKDRQAEPTKATPTEPRADREARLSAEAEQSRKASITDESRPEKREKDTRYRSLFQAQSSPRKPSAPEPMSSEDRPIPPALHPATPAIYIRNFMRPLRPEGLRSHLVSLASPPSSSPDPSILKTLFIDNMRTHALALFTNTSAAARVRASLHGSIWPHERDRKELWVDFIPEDKIETWISIEESEEREARDKGRRPNLAKKFEVVYRDDVNEDGGMVAIFQPVDTSNPDTRRPAPLPPLGPSSSSNTRPTQQPPPPSQSTKPPPTPTLINTEKPFTTLSQLFLSTVSKPKIYFLPVSPSLADARLDDLANETARDWSPGLSVKGRGRGYLDEKVRYGFDGDRVVEVGRDFGTWAEEGGSTGGGYRGGRGGYRGRGGWRGDGGFRGRGGWRSGGVL